MVRLWRRLEELAGKIVFCGIVMVSVGLDRIGLSDAGVEATALESDLNPQHSLVRLIALLLAGSLSMIVLGYRARV
jgi:hypothetical protein